MVAYAAAAVVWLVQRTIQVVLTRKAAAAEDPRMVAGIAVGSMIGRGWLVALTILAVGLTDGDARVSPPPSSCSSSSPRISPCP